MLSLLHAAKDRDQAERGERQVPVQGHGAGGQSRRGEQDGDHRRRKGPAGGGGRRHRHRLPRQLPAQEDRPRRHRQGGGGEARGEETGGEEARGRAAAVRLVLPQLLPVPPALVVVVTGHQRSCS